MLSASAGFAVPEKILNRSSFTTPVLRAATLERLRMLSSMARMISNSRWTRRDAEGRFHASTRGFTPRYASYERTVRARVSRKRRSDRAETQQRLGAPSLGSGIFQTPPNRYLPARLLSLLSGARPA